MLPAGGSPVEVAKCQPNHFYLPVTDKNTSKKQARQYSNLCFISSLEKLECRFQHVATSVKERFVVYDKIKMNCTYAENVREETDLVYCKKCTIRRNLKREYRQKYKIFVVPFNVTKSFIHKKTRESHTVELPVACFCDKRKK